MNGIFNINKPPGITSHRVVEIIRKTIGTRRAGHTGTLDPFATGVLIVPVGTATRLSEYIRTAKKTYNAVLKLGEITDTYDRTGIKKKIRVKHEPSLNEIEKVLSQFIGEIEQIPPMFSAKKIGGKKLYEIARQEKEIKRHPQKVTILDIKMLDYQYPYLKIKVACSSGTYIRSLAFDIGKKLKCGAYLDKLQRTRVGNFTIKDSVMLKEFTPDNWKNYLFPSSFAVDDLPKIKLKSEQVEKIRRGMSCQAGSIPKQDQKKDIAVFSETDELIAIATYDAEIEMLKPKKVLI